MPLQLSCGEMGIYVACKRCFAKLTDVKSQENLFGNQDHNDHTRNKIANNLLGECYLRVTDFRVVTGKHALPFFMMIITLTHVPWEMAVI